MNSWYIHFKETVSIQNLLTESLGDEFVQTRKKLCCNSCALTCILPLYGHFLIYSSQLRTNSVMKLKFFESVCPENSNNIKICGFDIPIKF